MGGLLGAVAMGLIALYRSSTSSSYLPVRRADGIEHAVDYDDEHIGPSPKGMGGDEVWQGVLLLDEPPDDDVPIDPVILEGEPTYGFAADEAHRIELERMEADVLDEDKNYSF